MFKVWRIFLTAFPILLMIGLIPLVGNDYVLALLDVIIIIVALAGSYEKNEVFIFFFGFVVMIIFEYFFVSTGVEIFERNTLFGAMPLWLPFVWGYGFLAIRRGIEIVGF